MKDIKDITLEDFVFKDEKGGIERHFIASQVLDVSYDAELNYFLKDEKFLEEFDEVFKDYNANLLKKKSREKVQYVYETLCNPERGYVLKTLIFRHIYLLLLKNLENYVCGDLVDKLKLLLKNID